MMRLPLLLFFAFAASSVLGLHEVQAQHPLWLINGDTRIRDINFQYLDTRTLEPGELRTQIATPDPPITFRNRFLRLLARLPLIPAPKLPKFNPVELQKDVVRMRRFYRDNGFLEPEITYPNSQLDTTSNTIQVIFSIREGPPLVVRDFVIVGPDSAAVVFDEERKQRDWEALTGRLALRAGDRYTEFRRITTRDEVANWLKNRGHAFAQVALEPSIDATEHIVDLRFTVDPGPVAYVDSIEVSGQRSVDRRAIVRELPFQRGDRFSSAKLAEGQRELFGLNLFRFALAEVPAQERDNTVNVRFRVEEARLRTLTAETGFSPESGLLFKAGWLHRNFSGGARNLALNFETLTGYPEALVGSPADINRLFLVSATLRQPYFFSRKASFSIGPRIEARKDRQLQTGTGSLGLNRFEAGVTTSVLYEILPFRTINVDYSISYAQQLTSRVVDDPNIINVFESVRDPYVKSVFAVSATLGKMNDYVNPRRGYFIRPSAQFAGNIGAISPGVEFNKLAVETIGLVQVGPRTSVGIRGFAGRLWTFGKSRAALSGPNASTNDRLKYQDRFDQYFYYAGGSNDVRGWDVNKLGPKTPTLIADSDTSFVLEADGGTTKLGGNIELRAPFFGNNEALRSAVFLEGAKLYSSDGASSFRVGTGLGIRYQTPVGFIRLDLAYKVNPSRFDLLDAQNAFCEVNPGVEGCAAVLAEPEGKSLGLSSSQWRRFRVHLSIGQTF